jgi:hypothetical protein
MYSLAVNLGNAAKNLQPSLLMANQADNLLCWSVSDRNHSTDNTNQNLFNSCIQ